VLGVGVFYVLVSLDVSSRPTLYVYAIGGNERVVELAGVRTRRVKVVILILSGITAGVAGLLLTAQLGAAGQTLGSTILLDSIAAIVIGGTALSGGVGGVGRPCWACWSWPFCPTGSTKSAAAHYTQTIIKGLVIIVAAIFTMVSQRKLIVK
jgi:ribose transport system permease protein